MRLTPRSYQRESIDRLRGILSTNPGAVDGSDGGLGKTLVATEVMRAFNQPTLVVCPKVVIPSWHRHAEAQGTSVSVINWELVRGGRTPYGEWYVPPRCRNPRFRWNDNIKFIIADEIHKAMTYGSKNSELIMAARRQRIPCLGLSATLADSPLEMGATGYLLGLHDGDSPPTVRNPDPVGFYRWAQRHNCRRGPFNGFEFFGSPERKAEVMDRIRAAIYPARGVRVRLSDTGDELPESQITSELFSLGDEAELNRLYAAMAAELAALQDRIDQDKPSELTPILRQRQQIELLKVPGMVELAKEASAGGKSVAMFLNFSASLRAVCEQLETDCYIDGSQIGASGATMRERNRTRFQSADSPFIVVNSEAGGVGLDLHDTIGGHPREALIFAGYNAKTLQQVTFRVNRIGSRSKSFQRILFAAGTVEEKVHRSLSVKMGCLDALNDGDLDPL